MLSAGTGGAENFHLHIGRVDFHLYIFHFRVVQIFDAVVGSLVAQLVGELRQILVAVHQGVFRRDFLQFVALAVQFLPQQILQLGQSLARHRRDEYGRKVIGQGVFQHLYQLFIQQVALGNGQDTMLVEHFRVEPLQLVEKYFIFFLDVVRVPRHHEQ